MKKKQELRFLGFKKDGQQIVTSSIEPILDLCATDPKPLNRKSKRALPKLIKKALE